MGLLKVLQQEKLLQTNVNTIKCYCYNYTHLYVNELWKILKIMPKLDRNTQIGMDICNAVVSMSKVVNCIFKLRKYS